MPRIEPNRRHTSFTFKGTQEKYDQKAKITENKIKDTGYTLFGFKKTVWRSNIFLMDAIATDTLTTDINLISNYNTGQFLVDTDIFLMSAFQSVPFMMDA